MEDMIDDSKDETSDDDYFDDLNGWTSEDEIEMDESLEEVEEDYDDGMEENPWNWQQTEFDVPQKTFDQPSGHNTQFTLQNSALEIFSLFFTSSLLNFIVMATNLHAQQIIGSFEVGSTVRNRLEHDWYSITVEELAAFMGIYLLTDLFK